MFYLKLLVTAVATAAQTTSRSAPWVHLFRVPALLVPQRFPFLRTLPITIIAVVFMISICAGARAVCSNETKFPHGRAAVFPPVLLAA